MPKSYIPFVLFVSWAIGGSNTIFNEVQSSVDAI